MAALRAKTARASSRSRPIAAARTSSKSPLGRARTTLSSWLMDLLAGTSNLLIFWSLNSVFRFKFYVEIKISSRSCIV